jgi:hypothetical protein
MFVIKICNRIIKRPRYESRKRCSRSRILINSVPAPSGKMAGGHSAMLENAKRAFYLIENEP